MSSVKNDCIPSMSVGKAVESLSNLYAKMLINHCKATTIPTVFLWGAPGIGKSECVREIADELEKQTKKKLVITDVRLLLYSPVDIKGVPTSNVDKTLSVWLKPKIFDMDPSEDVINILFLDELSACPPAVQAASYQICLDHCVGEHKLPENCLVIAAGNRVTDKGVAFAMPKPLANRLMHFEMETNFDSWKKWAVSHNINHKVIGFLSFRPDYLMKFDPSTADLAYPTPRSWTMVSNVLNNVGDNLSVVYPLICGLIGTGAAVEFKTWDKVYDKLPRLEDIFSGKTVEVPKDPSCIYALSASMVSYVRAHQKELDSIERSIDYVLNFPADFAIVTLKDYMYIDDDFKKVLMKMPNFLRYVQTRGKILNAI